MISNANNQRVNSLSIVQVTNANLTHKAFELVPFVEKLPLQIECMTCFNNIFILGTSGGRMLVYEVKINSSPPQKLEASFEKSISATKKPIQQLEAIKAFDILITLFDNQVHIFDLEKYQLQYSMLKTKNCSLFTTSVSSDQKLLRLVVVCKKKLQFYYINVQNKSQNLFMELISDLELNDVPRSIEFTKENLIVFSFRKEYYYYELPTTSAALTQTSNKQPEPRFTTGSRALDPLIQKLHNDYFSLGVEDNKTILYDTKGKPYLEYPIIWTSCPLALCSIGYYLVGILPATNSIEIVTIQPESSSVQLIEFSASSSSGSSSIPINNSGTLGSAGSMLSSSLGATIGNTLNTTVTGITNVLSSATLSSYSASVNAADRLKLVKSNGNSICYIATQSNVWCLTPIKINDQLEQVIRFKSYDLGLNLISSQLFFNKISECPFAKSWLAALSLTSTLPDHYTNEKNSLLTPFFALKYLLNEVDENLIRRIKHLNALSLFGKKRFSESLHLFQEMKTDPSHLIAFLPGLLPDGYRSKLNLDDYFPALDSKEQEEAIASLIDYLQYKRNEFLKEGKLNNDSSFVLTPLIDGRPVFRTRSQVLQIIDTTLLKCYLRSKENLVQFFLRRDPNFLHLDESERLLNQHNKINELIILYEKKDAHERALNLLINESTKNNSSLFGFKHIVDYLKKLGCKNIELMLTYGKRVIESDPQWGIKIFTSGDPTKIDDLLIDKLKQKETVVEKNKRKMAMINGDLPRDKTRSSSTSPKQQFSSSGSKQNANRSNKLIIDDYDFEEDDDTLKSLDHEQVCNFFNQMIQPKEISNYFVRAYLQYCIYIWNDKNANLNNLLIEIYKIFIENDLTNNDSINHSLSSANLIFLSSKKIDKKMYKNMLIYFLTETNNYEPSFALSKLDLENYAEERAIVLGKMGKHREALSIYVNILNDVDKAEAYCEHVYSQPDILDSKQVFYQLLQIYLNSDYEEVRIGASMHLLNTHSNEIGTSKTLELLPAELMNCKNLSQFFENMLNRLVRNKHDTQIKTRLMIALQLQVHENKIMCQDKKFTVTDEQICKECNKRMGKSAMVRYPNGTLIHYGCLKNFETTYSSKN